MQSILHFPITLAPAGSPTDLVFNGPICSSQSVRHSEATATKDQGGLTAAAPGSRPSRHPCMEGSEVFNPDIKGRPGQRRPGRSGQNSLKEWL